MPTVHLLDYGAGNVRSIRNAIKAAGYEIIDISKPEQLKDARILVFPGVGCFSAAVHFLDTQGFRQPLIDYIHSGRPYMGICLGMQTLFESSEETPGFDGLGVIPGAVTRFPPSSSYSVPHIGWNGCNVHKSSAAFASLPKDAKVYFVHSYCAMPNERNAGWALSTTDYGGHRFISSVQRGPVFATQFHPEKSGQVGLQIFRNFLDFANTLSSVPSSLPSPTLPEDVLPTLVGLQDVVAHPVTTLAKRIVACLDVRTNDDGDLVVTKGDKYDVREKDEDGPSESSVQGQAEGAGATGGGKRAVRNLGKPVDLCARYYLEGADEVAFLNITAFRSEPLEDTPMLGVLESASERVFVPLTIGGGIRAYTDSTGQAYSALDVAARYFRAGADKISIGSDAVLAAEAYYAAKAKKDGSTAIEQIAEVYGRQAVVVSVDPRRVYVKDPSTDPDVAAHGHVVVKTSRVGPQGEEYCWYQCTVKGGREGRPLCAVRLAQAVEALGAGELLVNCVDNDGQKAGYDHELLTAICHAVTIPVIASSGAGVPAHFSDVFRATRVEAALAAGIFHRKEVGIEEVKGHLRQEGVPVRTA